MGQTSSCLPAKRGMTGGVLPCLLAMHQWVDYLGFLDLTNFYKSSTSLRVVRAGFAWDYRLHEGNQFVSSQKRK